MNADDIVDLATLAGVGVWTEADMQNHTIERAKACGWRVYHTYLSERSEAGFPDLVMLRPPEALFVELKKDDGKATPAQDEWLAMLAACGLETHVYRPRDFQDVCDRLA